MINKRFSLHEAYSFGFKTVFNYFGFFVMTMGVGMLASLVFLSLLGMVDYWMFSENFKTLFATFSNAMNEATGAIHPIGLSMLENVRAHLPAAVSKHVSVRDAIMVNISTQDMMSLLKVFLPVGIAFKLFLDLISIGWTKIALDIQASKAVAYDYLFKFYRLVPRVFVVDLLVAAATLFGLIFLLFPGIFLYQRLRFARYFVIDKDQSIMDSLKSSWDMTDNSVIHLVGYSILAAIVSSIGNSLFLVALIVLPLAFVVDANVYRQMVK